MPSYEVTVSLKPNDYWPAGIISPVETWTVEAKSKTEAKEQVTTHLRVWDYDGRVTDVRRV